MTPKVALALLFATLMVLPLSTRACAVGFKPETSGFALNPTLKRLTVTSSKLEKTEMFACCMSTTKYCK